MREFQTARRQFLSSLAAGALMASASSAEDKPAPRTAAWRDEVGITTSSLSGHLAARPAKGKFTLLELPRILRDELDMRVIDLNTSALASYEPGYLEKVRRAADDAGCWLTNLKLNQSGLDMNSPQADVRGKAIAEYKRSIDAAGRLGLQWARPLPLKPRPDMKIHVASYRELCEHAAARGVEMLVENYGWMQADPQSVVKLIKAIGDNVTACPDTGNWDSQQLRRDGLKATFPIAATCDYKARALGADGSHAAYDLKECFQIGWDAGFRGPWCLEHANRDRAKLFRELAMLRDMLRGWQAGKS
jgi:hypothetical protein